MALEELCIFFFIHKSPGIAQHMRQYGEIAAEANLLHLRTGTYLIGVEVGFRFAGDAQQVSKLVGVSGGVLRRKQVAVQG